MSAAKNKKAGFILAGVVFGMIGMAYAAVPLYEIFCRVTGFGGTTQVAADVTGPVLEREIKVRFTAHVNSKLPWDFKPAQNGQEIRIGEKTIAFYEAHNPTGETITGTAVFNVTPFKAGEYFNKIECFCFSEQTLKPGERVEMPVTYFVDPALAKDDYMDDVSEIVLSYTFYLAGVEDTPEADHTAMKDNGHRRSRHYGWCG